METRANTLIVGLFVLGLIAAGLGFTYWLRADTLSDAVRYRVLFDGPVVGLSRASSVLFNGLPVGRVAGLSIYAQDTRKIEVTVLVDAGTPVRENSTARIIQRGLTAQPALQISPGTPNAALLQPFSDAAPGLLKADQAATRPLLEAAPEALASADAAFSRINALVAANEDDLRVAITNLAQFSQVLSDNRQGVADVLAQVGTVAEQFRRVGPVVERLETFVVRLDEVVARNEGRVDATLTNVEALSARLKAQGEGVEAIVNDAREAARGLTAVGPMLERLNQAVTRLDQVIETNAQGVNDTVASLSTVAATLEKKAPVFAELVDDAGAAARGAKRFGPALAEAEEAFAALKGVVEDNAPAIATSVAGISQFAQVLEKNAGNVNTIAIEARTAAEGLRRSADKIETTVDEVQGMLSGDSEGAAILADLRGAIASFRELSDKLNVAVGDNAQGLTRTAKRSLQEIELFARDARRAAKSFDRLMQKVERNPQSLIFGGSSETEYRPR